MKLKKYLYLSIPLLVATLAISTAQAQTTPTAVNEIDIEQYLGKWYEIAHLPMYFQRQCASDTTAKYRLLEDKTLSVENTCKTKSGEVKTAKGIAYPQNQGNSKLKVSFLPQGLRWLPFTKGDYWILRIDADYQHVLVGGPSKKYLWILSRTPHMSEELYQSYLKTAKKQGYDVSKLIKNPHYTASLFNSK